jgi:CO/xanthine dehydrogenase Mo-binding subunit
MNVFSNALTALGRATCSRREVLKGTGALIVGVSATHVTASLGVAQGPFATHASHVDPQQLDAWLAVAADGTVTAYTGKCELGQGMLTAQTQLVAEELSVPVTRVHLMECDTAMCPDQGTTSGSQSTPSNFNTRNLAQAAATAREALLQLAAAHLAVSVEQLTIHDGVISATADRTKSVSYGELVAGRQFNMTLSTTAPRKPASAWTVLGQPVLRLDMAAMVAGQFEYVHNVRVSDMLHGRVVRPPAVGATLLAVDETSVRDVPGLVKVVLKNNFVGVVAERQWQAVQAAEKLKVRWTAGVGLPHQGEFYGYLRHQQPSRDMFVVNSQDVDETLAQAAAVIKATYLYPYQAHASIGASCAVADVRSGKATLWSATQSVYPTRSGVALLLGLPVDNVRVIYRRGAGCYGLNGADTVSYDAALLSQAVGRPVRVQLSRRNEMVWENYGQAYVIDQRVGVDRDGTMIVWDYEAWAPQLGSRPGYDKPGNVVTGWLAGFEPQRVVARPASAVADQFRNNSNAAPSYIVGCVGGACGGAGTVRSERVLSHTVPSPFFTGPLRSPARLQNTFAHECCLDEVAAHVQADPVAYRLRHLRDHRLIEVVQAVATAAAWETRPSPQPQWRSAGLARGRGMACVVYEGNNGYGAMVTEVEVEQATGKLHVTRFVAALDCGPISNPDGLRAQIEGGTLQGLSRALGEEVTWDAQQVTSIDWQTYHSLPLGFDVPRIDSVLLNRTDVPAAGAGETVITLVAAALGNAIFDATGARLRQVPFTPERIKVALEARPS